MPSPPSHWPLPRLVGAFLVRCLLASALFVTIASSTAAAAQHQQPDAVTVLTGGVLEGIAAGIVTLIVGGLLIGAAEETTDRVTDRALRETGISFLYGVGVLILSFVLVVALVLTVIGILLVIPLILLLIVLAEFGYLAIGRAFVSEWGTALVIAVVVAAFAGGVPVLGGIVGFVVGSIGTGAFVREYFAEDRPPRRPGADPLPASRS